MNKWVLAAVFSAVVLMSNISIAETEQAEPSPFGDRDDRQNDSGRRAREQACDCCSACMAAKRSVRGKEEGPPALDGCRDCCRKCGRDIRSLPEMPPEIVK